MAEVNDTCCKDCAKEADCPRPKRVVEVNGGPVTYYFLCLSRKALTPDDGECRACRRSEKEICPEFARKEPENVPAD